MRILPDAHISICFISLKKSKIEKTQKTQCDVWRLQYSTNMKIVKRGHEARKISTTQLEKEMNHQSSKCRSIYKVWLQHVQRLGILIAEYYVF